MGTDRMSQWPSAPSYDAQLGALMAIEAGLSPFPEPPPPPPATFHPPHPVYGAIAVSYSADKWAFAWRAPSSEAAETGALKACGQKDAKILVSGANEYLAFVTADGTLGFGKGVLPDEAILVARWKLTPAQNARLVGVIHAQYGLVYPPATS